MVKKSMLKKWLLLFYAFTAQALFFMPFLAPYSTPFGVS